MRASAAMGSALRWAQGRVGMIFIALAVVNVLLVLHTHSGSPFSSNYAASSSGSGSLYQSTAGLETRWRKGIAGVNVFDNLYLREGTWFIVTSDPSKFPDPGFIMAAHTREGTGLNEKHPDVGKDWLDFVHPRDVESVLGKAAIRKESLSMFFNDQTGPGGGSFLSHYFHFIGEVFLAAWRAAASAYGSIDMPARIMYRTEPEDWRDHAGLTTWFQQSIMPKTLIEDSGIWTDRINSKMTFVFDKVAIVDRFAAHKYSRENGRWNKMTAHLPELDVADTWMKPLRDGVKDLLSFSGCDLRRKSPRVPIVTYINRQLTSRRLVDEDAAALLVAMKKLESEGVIEFNNAQMENYSRDEQFCMAMKTDILIGVHGNGLSHMMWMRPNGAVLEFMKEGGFARDYNLLADLMGHEYYAIHRDHHFPREKWIQPSGQAADQGPDFHSPSIRVDAQYISDMVSKLAAARSAPVKGQSL